jgi:plasmid stabilization system protein ParE
MSMSIFYSEQAENDIQGALNFYRGESEALGSYFLTSIKHAEIVVSNNPEGFQVRFFDRIRAYPLKKFPFLILYVLEKDSIYILAVFNTNQDPELLKIKIGSK